MRNLGVSADRILLVFRGMDAIGSIIGAAVSAQAGSLAMSSALQPTVHPDSSLGSL